MAHNLQRVTCKAAIFTPDREKVLVVAYKREYSEKDYGLPGGHLEKGEDPDAAIAREIDEELGISSGQIMLEKRSFWRHRDGKIILGYCGVAEQELDPHPDDKEIDDVLWVAVEDIKTGAVDLRDYNDFVIQNAAS